MCTQYNENSMTIDLTENEAKLLMKMFRKSEDGEFSYQNESNLIDKINAQINNMTILHVIDTKNMVEALQAWGTDGYECTSVFNDENNKITILLRKNANGRRCFYKTTEVSQEELVQKTYSIMSEGYTVLSTIKDPYTKKLVIIYHF